MLFKVYCLVLSIVPGFFFYYTKFFICRLCYGGDVWKWSSSNLCCCSSEVAQSSSTWFYWRQHWYLHSELVERPVECKLFLIHNFNNIWQKLELQFFTLKPFRSLVEVNWNKLFVTSLLAVMVYLCSLWAKIGLYVRMTL